MSIYRMRTEFGKYLKPILYIIAVVFIFGAVWSFGVAPESDDRGRKELENAIAKVNGIEVSRGEYEVLWEKAMDEAKSRRIRSPLQYAELRAMTFQQLVNSRLILSAAKQMGVDVSDRKVNERIDELVTEYLKQNREAVLGKLDKEQMELDPRRDKKYKQELASINSSLKQQEDFAKSRIPPEQVRGELAMEGIQAKIKKDIKPATEADITASYNVYRIRQIVLPPGKSEEQTANLARKIVSEAKAGTDFAKLARDNSEGQSTGAGETTEYAFEMRFMFPPEVRDTITSLKPGAVGEPVATQFGTYIVKLDSVTPKVPEKLDKKAKDARRKEIAQDREMSAAMAFEQKLRKNQKVQVTDSELNAYWQLYEARQNFADQAEYQKRLKLAIASLEKAQKERPNNYIAVAKLADLLHQDGRTEQAVSILYPMLEGENATIEGADVRLLLGDMLTKTGEKDKALDQYKVASEVAHNDPAIHQQLLMKFQQLGKPELVAQEQKWLDDYQKQMEEFRAAQEEETRKSKPEAPKPGE